MDQIIQSFLRRVVTTGSLRVTTARGTSMELGDGTGPRCAVRMTTPAAERRLMLDADLRLGELFMDGEFVVEEGSIYEVLEILFRNIRNHRGTVPTKLLGLLRYAERRLKQFNPAGRSKQNVAHHYDLDARLYSLFLDSDRQYSCAYFEHPDQSLEDAQLAKKRHLAAKLLVEPGMKTLDIGSGWGGLGLYLADLTGADVLGVTLSEEQLAVARARAQERGLGGHVRFELQDYRTVDQTFDRIISVGMFEHVGVNHYQQFFETCARLLDEDGVFVLHSIGRCEGPGFTNPWIDRYIFPGGYTPALSEVVPIIERCGLVITDVEILRLHYAETLRHWRERFLQRREEAEALYDERFCRMWEFYLAACEVSFRYDGLMVFQIQMAKNLDSVPLTRSYMPEREEALRARESSQAPMRLAGE